MGKGDAPAAPDYEAAAKDGVMADLETYPMKYLVEAASKMGGKINIGGEDYDFTGLGDADTAGVMSDQMAQAMLDIQRDLGPQFVKQRIEQLKQADPEGYAARKDLFDRIIASTEANPNQPLADDLQQSIVGELQNAGRLDARQLEQVQQNVRGGQVARGNFLGTAAAAQEGGAVVQASDAQRDATQQQSLGFLNSGVTPEDVQYRKLQQSLANLGAFIGGTTPTAEFSSLSAAGNGAAPFIGGGYNTQTTNPNAGAAGVNNAANIYTGQNNWAQQQVNPYLAGLSFGTNTASALAKSGWQPWATGFTPGAAPAGTTTMNGTSYAPGVNPWGTSGGG